MITLENGISTNPLDAFANARAEAEKTKAALLARLEEIKVEAKSIKAALGRTRGPNKGKPGRKPKNAPIEK
jgi:hypothetical protein